MMFAEKAFKAAAFKDLNESPGFEFELEATLEVLRKGYSIHEIPIPYSKRKFGQAKIIWGDGFKTMVSLVKYCIDA